MQRKKELARETFAIKPVDLSGKIPVKLNHKTTVYVRPGTDIEKLKKQLRITP